MKRKDLEKIIAISSVFTLSFVNALEVQAEIKSIHTQQALVCELKNTKETIVIEKDMKIKEIQEKAEEVKKEREEVERQRLIREEERVKAIEEAKALEITRMNSVGVNLDNVLEPSNITAEELYQVFVEMGKEEMSQLAWAITDAESITGINSLFLAGLIANESAYNTSYRAIYQNNVTGFAAYNSGAEGSYFVDKYSCIIQTAEWLKNEYLSPEGRYFNGYTTYHINIRYCLTEDGSSTDFNWSTTINNIAKTIESYYHKFVKEI